MSFACRHHNFNTNKCNMLLAECVPGRRGCVLEGRITISEELEKKLRKLSKSNKSLQLNKVK